MGIKFISILLLFANTDNFIHVIKCYKYSIDLNVVFIYYTQIFPNIYHKDSITNFNIVNK